MRDRIRESLFNRLGERVQGKQVFDLFAGTGALGIEAISRGAEHATFVEQHYPTYLVLKKNIETLELENQCEAFFGDAFVWVRRAELLQDRAWLVFVSPPYRFYEERLDDMRQLVETLYRGAPAGSLMIVESEREMPSFLAEKSYDYDWRSHGDTVVTIVSKD